MPLSIKFKSPKYTYRICILFWLMLILFLASFLFIMKPSIAILWQLVAIGLVLVVALLNIWQLHHYFSKYQAIYWYNDCWYLLINNRKTAINVEADTRVLPYWVLLQYTPIKNSILSKNKLLLPKDAMCDKDYRDLSRTLRFIEQTTETSIS